MTISKIRIVAMDGTTRSLQILDTQTGRPLKLLHGHLTGISFAPFEPGQAIRAVMYVEMAGVDLEIDTANIQFVVKKSPKDQPSIIQPESPK